MGEEEKKPEEKKPEEAPAAEKPPAEEVKKDEKKPDESKAEPPPPPPQEIVLKVFMHCEGCARKVRRCLKGFEGVEDVITDCRTSKVVVKGEKADPLKVFERVQMKSHRTVELISPVPKPPAPAPAEDNKPPAEKEAAPKPEEKIEEPPVVTVVLGVYMHCEACAQEIKKRIQRMKGVESVEPDLKSSQVAVKGSFVPEKLADYIHKRTGKHAVIVKVEPEKKDDEKPKEDKIPDESEKAESKKVDEESAAAKENKESGDSGGGDPPAKAAEEAAAEDPKLELRKNEFNYYYPHNNHHHQVYYPHERIVQEYNNYAYPPQMFSDENPNACSVM